METMQYSPFEGSYTMTVDDSALQNLWNQQDYLEMMQQNYLSYYDLIKQQTEENNAWSAEQAQRAMDYQTEMSNTAHQREVADLRAAGLNPVLSAGGQGATTGTGHAASGSDANITALYGLISKAMDAQMVQAQAMNNTAKSISTGLSSTPSSGSSAEQALEDYIRDAFDDLADSAFDDEESSDSSQLPSMSVFSITDALGVDRKDAINFLARALHVPKNILEMAIKYIGEDVRDWPVLPSHDDRNNRYRKKKSAEYMKNLPS